MIIERVDAQIIKDSREQETIEVRVNNASWASSPNGKSTGDYETKQYYKSIRFCRDFLNKWDEKAEINEFNDLIKIENIICKKLGLKNAKMFGANSLFAFESAVLKALAKSQRKELFEIFNLRKYKMPYPAGNVVGGGLHSSAIKIHPNFQEFLVIPKSNKFFENRKIMNYVYQKLKEHLKPHGVNDEGAWLVSSTDEEAIEALNNSRIEAEKKFKTKVDIGIDAATSSLYKKRAYFYDRDKFTPKEQKVLMEKLILNYKLFYAEDSFEQHDFKSFSKLCKAVGKRCLIIGDDLTATQFDRVLKAAKMKSINAMIIKPNQNGSLIELHKIFGLCRKYGIKTILSHRSGETLDGALADYAVGFNADFIKCGVATKWREAKLDRLAKIEKKIRLL